MTDISVVQIEEKEEVEQVLLRVPSGIKAWIDGKALELGYNRNAYIIAVFKAMMEDENDN